MKKKILTAVVTLIMAALFVTSIYADNPCPFCGGVLTNPSCGFTNIDNCDLGETTCYTHNNCIKQYYYADTEEWCNSCKVWITGANTHYHAVGHREVGTSYPYSMATVCPWW